MLEAKRTLEVGLPVTILGTSSTGKTEIARELNNQAFGKSKLTIIDCIHLDPESFETLLFGENGKLDFFDHDQEKSCEGKLFQARGGMVFFKNAQTIPKHVQDLISTVMEFEEKKRENSNYHPIKGWLFSAPQDWLEGNNYEISSKFENAIQGKKLTAPPLSQRSDFEKLAMSIIASCSHDHTLSPVALRILRSSSWTGNFSQLKKVIRLAVSQSSERIIRQEITEALSSFVNDGLQPCTNCHGSPVRSETCIMIQRTWSDTGGNVSLVSRRLGVSRNTVYKHVKNIQ
jgi:transcriptional regulator of acetoin/glycerol metabolism